MTPATTLYPVDLAGVKSVGVDTWLDTFRPLIRGEAYIAIHQAVFAAYLAAIPRIEESPAIYWSAAINYKMVPYIAHLQHRYSSLRHLVDKGYNDVGGAAPIPLPTAIDRLKNASHFSPGDFDSNAVLWLKENWRAVRTNYACHSPLKALRPNPRDGGLCLVGDRNRNEIKAYLADTDGNPLALRPLLHFGGAHKRLPTKDTENLTLFIRRFFDGIHREIPGSSQFLDDAFADAFSAHFERTVQAFNRTIERLSGGALGDLLVTNEGTLHIRVLAAAWRHLGGRTIGFSHGSPYSYAYLPGDMVNGFFLILDTYFASSKGEKKLLEQSREDFTDGFRTTATIRTFGNSIYRPLFDRLQAEPAPASVKTVMIIGFPMDYYFSPTLAELNTMTYLRLEIDLIRSLKKSGFTVIYKAHPDTLSESAGIFEAFADRVETRPFEEVYNDADGLLFTTHYTSAFGFALMTRRPVVLMASPKGFWHPETHTLLRKRCAFVEMTLGEDGILAFDDVSLRDAAKQSLAHMDFSIVTEYAL